METDTDQKRNIHHASPWNVESCGYPIVVLSHLGWDWVWQRPQQFLSRLSKQHRILFVEDPSVSDTVSGVEMSLHDLPDYPNITVLQTTVPANRRHERPWVDVQRRLFIQNRMEDILGESFRNPVLWFYDPMAVTAFAGQMNERAIVYDCMDELSQFKGAPPELVQCERQLLAMADVVFAGGPKIHRAKSAFHANCHTYGCGVDEKHFGIARNGAAVTPEDIAHLKGPVLGFFGVVDERMDYELIAKIADSEPSWHLVMVGPRTKVEEWVLPRRPNIHWLGGRDYARLPHYASRFNICLMPFALNEATEFINPTKALEYMATGRPIVSSAIDDVVLQFSKVAAIAVSHEEFIAQCRHALHNPDAERLQMGIEMVRNNSWEAIVQKLERHICEVLDVRRSG